MPSLTPISLLQLSSSSVPLPSKMTCLHFLGPFSCCHHCALNAFLWGSLKSSILPNPGSLLYVFVNLTSQYCWSLLSPWNYFLLGSSWKFFPASHTPSQDPLLTLLPGPTYVPFLLSALPVPQMYTPRTCSASAGGHLTKTEVLFYP